MWKEKLNELLEFFKPQPLTLDFPDGRRDKIQPRAPWALRP